MEHRLERYQDQQDAEYATAQREPLGVIYHDERIYLMREIGRIEKHLAEDEIDQYVPAEAWQERLADCKARLAKIDSLIERQKLVDEQATIQATIDLHCVGLIKCNTRILEIEGQLKQMEVR
jgi:hypothetical protein